ncbi:MAG TPA: type II toxin-antitoxin system Phd/YefM family antitoxin [Balneolales bacterium]|nr:type II toxin-antitoxin system Phd/YefM family antitoxin [Balneolales bacterium]
MKRIQLNEDILPLSEFRANASAMIDKVKKEHRPMVITQHGKSSVVLLGVSDYENLIETIELYREIDQARQEMEKGKEIAHEDVISYLKDRLKQIK